MARARVISSSIFDDEWYGPLDFFQQQLWIGLFAKCADDQGRLLDNPVLIRAAIFPYKDTPVAQIDAALTAFSEAGKLMRYRVGGKALIQLAKWWENQPMQWAAVSRWPAPEGWADRVRTRQNNRYVEVNWRPHPTPSVTPSPERSPEPSPDTPTLCVQAGGQVPRSTFHVPNPEDTNQTATQSDGDASASPSAQAPKIGIRAEQNAVRLALEVHFSEATGLPRPKTGSAKQRAGAGELWWTPLRTIAELVGWDSAAAIRLIDATLAQINGEFTVVSPKSIVNTALAVHTGNAAAGHRRARDAPRIAPPTAEKNYIDLPGFLVAGAKRGDDHG